MVTNNSSDYRPTQYNVQTGGASGTLNNVAPGATSGVPVISQGAASQPIFGTAAIAGGGTNATSMSTSTGIVKYDGTSLVTSTTAKIDSSNRYTNTSQPAFSVYLSSSIGGATGDGTNLDPFPFDATLLDQGTNFNTTTHLYTIPVTGFYQFNANIFLTQQSGANTNILIWFDVNSGTFYRVCEENFQNSVSVGNGEYIRSVGWGFEATAGNTIGILVQVSGSVTKNVAANGGASGLGAAQFSGFLVC